MRNAFDWKPTKFVWKHGRLTASLDESTLALSSRLSAGLMAAHYDSGLRSHARGRLLDLGCGKVPLYDAYRGLVSEVICVDWAKSHGALHLDAICDISRPLPFRDAAFDTIVMTSVLEHVLEPRIAWQEVARILAPGGKLLMNSPFLYGIHEQPHDYYRYTEFALRRFAFDSGLEVVELTATGGALEVLADILAKNLAGVPAFGRIAARGVQWMAHAIHSTSIGRKTSTKSARRFPLSYFLVARRQGG